jgi:class 3 adenylate cyclase
MNLRELGARIRAQREKCRLKQVDVAHALQISAQAVSKWERGENAPDIAILLDLTRLLGVTTDWLLGRTVPAEDTFPATVMCTSLNGFAKRSAALSPRDVAAWVNGLFQQITEAVLRFDGIPVKYVGDGFLGSFSGSAHADRALAAAGRARAVAQNPALVIVLHSGDLYLGSIGHPDYARPDIMGDTVNTAFLVMNWAALHVPSGVALTRATAARLAKPGRMKTYRDVRIKGLPSGITLHEPAWVGA